MKRKMIKCIVDGCEKLVRYDKRRNGNCWDHADWSKHSARMADFNIRTKTKKPKDKYRTEKIPSIERVCIICEKTYLATPAAIKKGGGVVCSRRCQGVRAAKLTPKKRTSIEVKVSNYLIFLGVDFVEQHPMCGVSLVDIYIPSLDAAVFCDGDYWHSIGNRKQKDAKQDKVIRASGSKVFRFSETLINKTNGACVEEVFYG